MVGVGGRVAYFQLLQIFLTTLFFFYKSLASAMPIRSPIGDLGPLGDFLVKIGPLLVPFYTKSPLFQICKYKKVL